MVIAPPGAEGRRLFRFGAWIAGAALLGACATSPGARKVQESRDAYLLGDLAAAEAAIQSKEAREDPKNRLQQMLFLASIAFSQGLYEKAIHHLDRGRELALELRSDRGFEIFSGDYQSNPIEFSHVHHLLVVARWLLAESGGTPAWRLPEVRAPDGRVLEPEQVFPERRFSEREIEELKLRARADLLAWDSHLAQLGRSYGGSKIYHEDPWARVLAAHLHGKDPSPRERRTAELLLEEALRELEHGREDVRSWQREERSIGELVGHLKDVVRGKSGTNGESLFVLEAGTMPPYRGRKVIVGLSTLFQGVEDPLLRAQLEQISLRVLLQFAPEFGLVAFAGAMAGAATAGDDPPLYLSEAVDDAFGFEMRFPSLPANPGEFTAEVALTGQDGREWKVPLPALAPLQEMVGRELQARSVGEWKKKAIGIGLQYLALLVPAVAAYRKAIAEGDWIRKLAILSGFFLAKKTIDRLHAPDLRSWSLMPQWVFAGIWPLPQGRYRGEWVLQGGPETLRIPLAEFEVPKDGGRLQVGRWGRELGGTRPPGRP